jgi:hypothetical protein
MRERIANVFTRQSLEIDMVKRVQRCAGMFTTTYRLCNISLKHLKIEADYTQASKFTSTDAIDAYLDDLEKQAATEEFGGRFYLINRSYVAAVGDSFLAVSDAAGHRIGWLRRLDGVKQESTEVTAEVTTEVTTEAATVDLAEQASAVFGEVTQ